MYIKNKNTWDLQISQQIDIFVCFGSDGRVFLISLIDCSALHSEKWPHPWPGTTAHDSHGRGPLDSAHIQKTKRKLRYFKNNCCFYVLKLFFLF